MSKSFVFLADGFEEIEALSTIDILRRAGIDTVTVAIGDNLQVTGAHGVTVLADSFLPDNDYSGAQWLILPGGMPGATNLAAHPVLCEMLVEQNKQGRGVAAICASPAVVLGPLGLLSGRDAVCYPGMEQLVSGVRWGVRPVAIDGNIITGNGPNAANTFALTIVAHTLGREAALAVADGMLIYPTA